MKPYAALLVALVLLGGCLGGVTVDAGGQAETATESPTVQATTPADGSADRTATDEQTTSADCGRAPAETRTEATADDTRETTAREGGTATPSETTTLPATTDADENVTATFVVEDCPNVTVSLLVADEPGERQRGLMYRQSLPERTGMVFVYDDAAPRTFWMKNTYIPLDIIFVAPDGTVLNVEHAQAQPHAPDSAVDRYSSDGAAMYVVELRRGFANRTGVGPGSELTFNGTAPEA